MADKNDRSLTPADRRRQKREAKEAKARERRIRARQGDRRLFPKVSKKAATAFVAVLFVLSVFWRLGPGSQAPRVQGTDAPAVAKKGATMIYKSGSYTVGTNLDAGQYKFLAAGGQTAAVSVDGGDAASFTTQCWLELSDGQKVEVSGATFA